MACHLGEAVDVFGLGSRRSIWSICMLYATECGIRVKAQSQINIIATAGIVRGINKEGRISTFESGWSRQTPSSGVDDTMTGVRQMRDSCATAVCPLSQGHLRCVTNSDVDGRCTEILVCVFISLRKPKSV